MGGGRKIFSRLRRKRVHFFGQLVDAALGLDQGLGERLAAAALADEVDEVGEPALLGGELGLLQLQRVGQVGAQLGDLLFDAPEDVGDVLRIGDLLLDRSEDDLLARVRRTSVLLSQAPFVAARQP